MITVFVGKGDGEQRFTVHKDMICAKSKFFQAACSKRWKSGKEKIVRPPDVTPEQFQIYAKWVYTSRVSVDEERLVDEQITLMDMYIFGDIIDGYQLRNITMERLIHNVRDCKYFPEAQCFDKVYAATPTGSPLRRFLVEWILYRASRKALAGEMAKWPAEFAQDLALAAVTQVPSTRKTDSVDLMRKGFVPETGSP